MKKRKDSKGHVFRKGEGQRKDGRYIFQYRDCMGTSKVVYAKDLVSLREKEREIQRDQLDGLKVYCEGKATINYVFERYIETRCDLKESTRINYRYMYNKFVHDTFGNKLIKEVMFSDVKYFYLSLINEKGLKPNTVDNIHTVLHPVFQMAVRDEVIRKNPTDGVMAEIKKLARKNKGIRHALTEEQQEAFLNYVETSPIYDHWMPMFRVFFDTGGRVGEVTGLRWDDVDFEENCININHSLIYLCNGKNTAAYKISSPKTEAGKRAIPMSDDVREAIKTEYEIQKIKGFNTDVIDGMSGFIFRNKNGNVLNQSVINSAIKRIYTEYNAKEILQAQREHRMPVIVPHFTCHIIRHTFCTRLCEGGANIKAIQDIMGHANIETTMDIYAEATKKTKREAINCLKKN